jgi:hypothetical protein
MDTVILIRPSMGSSYTHFYHGTKNYEEDKKLTQVGKVLCMYEEKLTIVVSNIITIYLYYLTSWELSS